MKKLRRAARQHGGRLLAALVGRQPANPPLDAASLRRIVVVRMNGRMGNTLFLTPLLTAISHALPAATIDLVVLYPEAAELLRGLPGVDRVMVLPHKGWWRLRRSLATLRAIRRECYDLAIDPSPDSLGGRLALMFCRARCRLGFGGRNQWASLTHAVDVPPDAVHEALRPLALLDLLPQPPGPRPQARLRLALGASELEAGRERIETSLAACALERHPRQPVIGFFAYARGNKSLGAEWWQRFWRRFLELEPGAIPLEVLPSAGCPPLLQARPALHLASPRQLAATMASMRLFVSADTGPMHLASATRVPVVALFGPTDPERFGPLKPEDTVMILEGRSPEEIAETCRPLVHPTAAAAADR